MWGKQCKDKDFWPQIFSSLCTVVCIVTPYSLIYGLNLGFYMHTLPQSKVSRKTYFYDVNIVNLLTKATKLCHITFNPQLCCILALNIDPLQYFWIYNQGRRKVLKSEGTQCFECSASLPDKIWGCRCTPCNSVQLPL
jgi:hypothetical protein